MVEKYTINGFIENSLTDWDGKIASVIFLSGCNFRCKFCHNKELVENNKLNNIPFSEIREYLLKNRDFVDGVVITGGEPCMYSSINELCNEVKGLGYKVKLETNGSFPEKLAELIKLKLIDFVAMDIKTSFDNYNKITNSNVNIENIKKSIAILRDFDYEFRITMFPEITKENLIELTRYLKENNSNKAFFIQQFRAENCLDELACKVKPYSKEELEEFLDIIKPDFTKSGLRNI